jgi:large subunit ribosomal protein L17
LLRNLASALFLTELTEDDKISAPGTGKKMTKRVASLTVPKTPGRIVTTLHKAKEVQPLVERCITIARRAIPHQEAADRLEPDADRNSDKWREWRTSDEWYEWNRTVAPAVAARRRVAKLLGDKLAVWVLFDKIAPRFEDRTGGYTRVLRLANPRLGDAGAQAILEFVGSHDRVRAAAPKPAFDDDLDEADVDDVATEEDVDEQQPADDVADAEDTDAEPSDAEATSEEPEEEEEKE